MTKASNILKFWTTFKNIIEDPISCEISKKVRQAFKKANTQTQNVINSLENVVNEAYSFEMYLEQDQNQLNNVVTESFYADNVTEDK